MNVPRYWARATRRVERGDGTAAEAVAWGWSSEGTLEARGRAEERVAALAERMRAGQAPHAYPYGARPLREEIVEEVRGPDGALSGVVTRNGYGSLVLNTAGALFIDVDVQPRGFWERLRPARARERVLGLLRDALAADGGGFRVYRTAAGFRVLGSSRTYDPAAPETEALMRACGADPAFVQLCRSQRSFRARLTPKPWRCGGRTPPGQHPRTGPDEDAFTAWRADYERRIEGRATCALESSLGDPSVFGAVRPLLDLHDRHTRAYEPLPLA